MGELDQTFDQSSKVKYKKVGETLAQTGKGD